MVLRKSSRIRRPPAQWKTTPSIKKLYNKNSTIYVSKSKLPNAGLGLFVNKEFKKSKPNTKHSKRYGEHITTYGGAIVKSEPTNKSHTFQVCKGQWVDGYRDPKMAGGEFGSFINRPNDSKHSNAMFIVSKQTKTVRVM